MLLLGHQTMIEKYIIQKLFAPKKPKIEIFVPPHLQLLPKSKRAIEPESDTWQKILNKFLEKTKKLLGFNNAALCPI